MTSAIETIDATTVKVTISLTEAELAPSITHAYEHIGSTLVLPGFRKGKVPAAVVRQRVEKGAVLEHAINEGLATWYGAAIEEHDLRPLGKPEVSILKVPGQTPGDEGLEFTATVEVRPSVTLPKLETITLTVKSAAVDEADVSARLDALRARFGTLVGVDRPCGEGDFVTLDLAAAIGGEEVDAVQGTSYQVGSGSMLEGLDEAVTGLSAGEETTYEGPLAAGDHAGEKALVRVKVTAVKRRELPVADDEFAQLASEFDTIAELRDEMRAQVAKVSVNNQAAEARALLLEHLLGAATFEMPRRTIEAEVHEHLEQEGRLADDEHRAEVTEEIEAIVRSHIVLDQLADDLGVDIEEEELLEYMISIARTYELDPEVFIAQAERSGRVPAMVSEVARSKAGAFALRRAKVVDTAGAVVDLSDVIGSAESDAQRAELIAKVRVERAASASARAAKARPITKAGAGKIVAKKKSAKR